MTGQQNNPHIWTVKEMRCHLDSYITNMELMDHPDDSEADLTGFYDDEFVASRPRDEYGYPIFDNEEYSDYHAQMAKYDRREFYSIYGVSVENFIDDNNEVDEAACERYLNDH